LNAKTPGAFVRPDSGSEKRHEVELQLKRLERQSEDRKLAILKQELKGKLFDRKQQPVIARAS